MATFTHDGKGHAALRRLACGPADREELSTLRRMSPSKAWHLMNAITDAGLAYRTKGTHTYTITDQGLAALAWLNDGRDYVAHEGVPSVRVFVRREAA